VQIGGINQSATFLYKLINGETLLDEIVIDILLSEGATGLRIEVFFSDILRFRIE
jgi:hypothetical protein